MATCVLFVPQINEVNRQQMLARFMRGKNALRSIPPPTVYVSTVRRGNLAGAGVCVVVYRRCRHQPNAHTRKDSGNRVRGVCRNRVRERPKERTAELEVACVAARVENVARCATVRCWWWGRVVGEEEGRQTGKPESNAGAGALLRIQTTGKAIERADRFKETRTAYAYVRHQTWSVRFRRNGLLRKGRS